MVVSELHCLEMHLLSEVFQGNISLDNDSGPLRLAEEVPVSSTFKFVLRMQLTLILFHTLLWLVGPA
jgi:hypothetical protein